MVRVSLPAGGLKQTGFMGQAGLTSIPNGDPGKIGDREQIGDPWVLGDPVTWTSIPIGGLKQIGFLGGG